MYKCIPYIIVLLQLLFSCTKVIAQIAMPDTVCVSTTRTYKVNNAAVPSTYTWKVDNITQNSTKNEVTITWNNPGVFLLTVQEHSNTGCDGDIRSGQVYVNPIPIANAGLDVIACFGNTVQLSGSGGTTFLWSPATGLSDANVANPLVNITQAGVYKYALAVSNQGCSSLQKDTIAVTILPEAKIFAGNDTSVAIRQPLQLHAIDVNNSGFINYSWSPSFGLNNSFIINPLVNFNNILGNNGITYTVTARTINGCIAKDNITIKTFLNPEIYVPSAFTPNNDGLNDFAVVIPAGIKELKYFTIYNRWGQLVFTTRDWRTGWNGIWNGVAQPNAVFAWSAEAIDYMGNTISRNGTITLIR